MPHEKKGPVTALKESFEQLEKDCKKYHEDYLRALADFDNYRRRVERDSETSRRLTLERLAMDLLPVLDNFDRAMAAVSGDGSVDGVKKGMELIHRQLGDVMCRHGIKEYSCLGEEFDPRRAEAIGFIHSDEQSPNTVVKEECKGYTCGERVLRPARVLVAKPKDTGRPAKAEPAPDEPAREEEIAG